MNKRISTNSTAFTYPQSFISKGKQRLKQHHNNTVYLNHGDEFEIELFNPTKLKVLAKIDVNGHPIGSGIVLRPGERVFLDRHIDVPKKFLFSTYVINAHNFEVEQATINNGDIKVSYFNEYIPTYSTNTYSHQPLYYSSNISFPSFGTFTTSTSNLNLTNNVNGFSFTNTSTSSPTRHVETGRIEKGSESNQTLMYDNTTFLSTEFCTDFWKIKPNSTKPVVKEDLVTYCVECGAKRKKDTFKFCPHCGTKY